jgi:hypothetical protein
MNTLWARPCISDDMEDGVVADVSVGGSRPHHLSDRVYGPDRRK